MQRQELEGLKTNPTTNVEIVLEDGSIVIGNEFKQFACGLEGGLNAWQIKPNDKTMRLVDGSSIKQARIV